MNFKTLLLEAAEFNKPEELLKAILRGQINNIAPKDFLGKYYNEIVANKTEVKSVLNSLYSVIYMSKKFEPHLRNKFISMLLKKAKNFEEIQLFRGPANQIIDAFKAYFNNVNKKEAKENKNIKKMFQDFEFSSLDSTELFNFETTINELFAQKATVKNNSEIEVIYPEDKEGWEVVSPKTFAAAKQLACIADRKAKWCTSANSNYFKSYTENNNKLYILRNEKENKMYQMDWGGNFKNEDDKPISIEEAEKNIPEYILNKLKNKKNISILSLLKKRKGTEEIENGWKITQNLPDAIKTYLKDYLVDFSEKNSLENLIKSKINKSIYLLNKEEDYYLIKKNDINNFKIFYIKLNKPIETITIQEFLKNKDLPNSIKKKFFGIEYKEEPKQEIIHYKNIDFYILKNKEAAVNLINDYYDKKAIVKEIFKGNFTKTIFFKYDKKNFFISLKNINYFYYFDEYYFQNISFNDFLLLDKKNFNNSFYYEINILIATLKSFLKKYFPDFFKKILNKKNFEDKEKAKNNFLKYKYKIYNYSEDKKIVYAPSEKALILFINDYDVDLKKSSYDSLYEKYFFIFYPKENKIKAVIDEDEVNEIIEKLKLRKNTVSTSFNYVDPNILKTKTADSYTKIKRKKEEAKQILLNKIRNKVKL